MDKGTRGKISDNMGPIKAKLDGGLKALTTESTG
jgi:hypothetical protein